eukprot:6312296-Ditylum_brightwellii.AAC.2
MGTYILDGLNPSSQITHKMRTQSVDKVQGNDFIAQNIGTNAELKYKIFCHFFAVQNPITMPPPKDKCPNYKVDSFFHGKSEYKVRCGKFKCIGDSIQADCIADDGYTWEFYSRNKPVPPKWLDLGFCPMQACLLHMFSNFKDDHHTVKMDNLFNSVMLCIGALQFCPRKALAQGVIRQSGRGVPPCVIQQELSGKRAEQACGTIKAAVLKGESHASNIIITSCYDQKTFYMISSIATQIIWNTVTKRVYSSAQLKRMVAFQFLRFSLSNDYNYEMNDNNISNQLRLIHRILWLGHNQKWWWALWLWGYE